MEIKSLDAMASSSPAEIREVWLPPRDANSTPVPSLEAYSADEFPLSFTSTFAKRSKTSMGIW